MLARWRNWDLCSLLVVMKTGTVIIENGGDLFFKKLNIQLPYVPAVSLLGIYPKELKSES